MFYDNLKIACEKEGISVTALVVKLGMSQGNLAKWKNGGTPKADTLAALANRLNTTTDFLVTGNLDKKEKPTPDEGDGLTDKEREMITGFRGASPEKQAAILELLK